MTEAEVDALLEEMKHSSVLPNNYYMNVNQLEFDCICKLNSQNKIQLYYEKV